VADLNSQLTTTASFLPRGIAIDLAPRDSRAVVHRHHLSGPEGLLAKNPTCWMMSIRRYRVSFTSGVGDAVTRAEFIGQQRLKRWRCATQS